MRRRRHGRWRREQQTCRHTAEQTDVSGEFSVSGCSVMEWTGRQRGYVCLHVLAAEMTPI